MTYKKPDMQSKKLLDKKRAKASELFEKLELAQTEADKLAKARKYYVQFNHEGLTVTHKMFGEGIVTGINGETATIHFPRIDEDKKFIIENAIDGGFLDVQASDLVEKRKEYHPYISNASFIMMHLRNLEEAYLPYAEYLE